MIAIDLNCDMGERDDPGGISTDLALLDIVTSTNIACGGHAGNVSSMERTVAAALQRGVAIGAHPSYPDRSNFGRVSTSIAPRELEFEIARQIQNLINIAQQQQAKVRHVKLHGALYHDAMHRPDMAEMMGRLVMSIDPALVVVGMSDSIALDIWQSMGLQVAAEAFADRRYRPDGRLASRSEPDSVIMDPRMAADQALAIVTQESVRLLSGQALHVRADTICIHSDTAGAVEIAAAVRAALESQNIRVSSLTG